MPAYCCIDRFNRLVAEDPDMPVFTLHGTDAFAVDLVKEWLTKARMAGVNQAKIDKVQEHLTALEKYASEHPERIKIPD